MSKIFIFKSPQKLEPYLKGFADTETSNHKFIYFGELDTNVGMLLEEHGISEVKRSRHDETYRLKFLQEYIDLIGTIGKEQNSRTWWASDIASKNRFMSNLPFLLHQFLTVIETIENEDYDHLIIINPSWVILDSLKKVFKKSNAQFVCFGSCFPKWKEICFGWCRRILSILSNTLRVSVRKSYFQNKLKHITKEALSHDKPSYVVKTFIYDHSISEDGIYRDSFFGSLPEFLRGEKQVLIYANILGNNKLCIEKIRKCVSCVILPVEMFLSYTDISRALILSLFCKIRIRKEVLFLGHDVSGIIKNELLRTYNGIPFYQLLHYWSTKNLIHAVSVETFLLTYENNPWEKMCMMAVREYSPKTRIIGYQHTVVPQASANMFISRKEQDIIPMPDKILTVGKAPEEIMERYGSYENGKIEPSCGLRFEYLFETSKSKRKKSGNILIVLEGIFEVYKMVNYVLRELQGNTKYKVVIRTHPVLPLNRMAHKLDHRIDDIPNFNISSNSSLKKDIEWADIVIYWGTTVALEALSIGKPVIHYEMDSVLSYDPLFECGHLKWVVSEKDPLIPTIDEIYSLSDVQFEAEQDAAKAYLNRYFFPINEEGLNKFLTSLTGGN
ncbi:MAG: hypothetical protein JW920_06545 [Deltaproteobacteria bacterium]|nr:hypothetical protein [Deltaproteobacteria bacterium]